MRISSENTERNLTAFQRGGQLYFSASRPLLPGNRLRVWYGDDYITRLHSLSEQSIDCSLHPGEPCGACSCPWLVGVWEDSRERWKGSGFHPAL